MTIGERIKKIRKQKGISVEFIAEALGVSKTTVYRYEDSTIEKIPLHVFDKLCDILKVSPAELMGNAPIESAPDDADHSAMLPYAFDNAQDAMAFMVKSPMLAAYGGYDPATMSDETIIEFANEILHLLKLASYKYKHNDSTDK